MLKLLKAIPLLCLLASPGFSGEETVHDGGADSSATPFWEKAAWYLPNRVMDLMDVFRLRVKAGPGLGAGARFTDAFSFYGGEAYTVYLGLPGPRGQAVYPAVAGFEQKRGLVILGLDASDDMPNPPGYGYSEIGASVHLLFVGVDAGVSPTELVDFFAGWIGRDPQGDDFPRRERPLLPPGGGVLRPLPMDPVFPVQPKPDSFPGLRNRLDYLQSNVPILLQGRMHTLDRALTHPDRMLENQPPVTDLRLSLYYEYISGPQSEISLDPDLKLRVDLPNFEQRLSLFVQSSYDDDLPGTDLSRRNDKGWSVGARRQLKKWNFSTDVGVHTKWRPELFTRASWRPYWQWEEWKLGYESRVFWENEDGFGLLNQLYAYRWIGDRDRWLFRTLTAGKFSESTRGLEWQQTCSFAHLIHLKDEDRRRRNTGVNDALDGAALHLSVFGGDERTLKYRSTLQCRKSLYRDFVVLQVEPGLEWRDENNWSTQYRLEAGVVLLF